MENPTTNPPKTDTDATTTTGVLDVTHIDNHGLKNPKFWSLFALNCVISNLEAVNCLVCKWYIH